MTRLTLVRVNETCADKRGRFLRILDAERRKVRFLSPDTAKAQFSALAARGHSEIVVAYRLECDMVSTVTRDRARQRVAMR